MPQVTVYIRDGDIEKWKAIGQKSQFLHEALQGSIVRASKVNVPDQKIAAEIVNDIGKVIKTPEEAKKATAWQGSNFKKGKK